MASGGFIKLTQAQLGELRAHVARAGRHEVSFEIGMPYPSLSNKLAGNTAMADEEVSSIRCAVKMLLTKYNKEAKRALK